MPRLVNGMDQTTGQELDDVQRAIEASLAVEKDEQAQKKVEMAQVDHAIKETTSAQVEVAAEQDRNDNAMKDILNNLSLKIRPVADDGNCFFHAVAMDLNTGENGDDGATSRLVAKGQPNHAMLREQTIDWMKDNQSSWEETMEFKEDSSPESRIIRMSRENEFADHIELVAMASLLRRQIHVYSWEYQRADSRKPYITIDPLPPEDRFDEMLSILNNRPILLFRRKQIHYDLLIDVSGPDPKPTYSVPQTENCICLVRLPEKTDPMEECILTRHQLIPHRFVFHTGLP